MPTSFGCLAVSHTLTVAHSRSTSWAGRAAAAVRGALEHHHVVDGLMAEIDQLEPEDACYGEKVRALQESVERHIEGEEQALFTQARIHLTDERLERLGWAVPAIIVASSTLRGAYHLYQGFGPFVGNAVMGVVFCLVYLRTRRVMPLVVAHTLLDVVAFVGYDLFGEALGL